MFAKVRDEAARRQQSAGTDRGRDDTAYRKLFSPNIRYTASALSCNLCNVAFGGTAPFIATAIVGATHSGAAPACYLLANRIYLLPIRRIHPPEQPELHHPPV